MSHSLHGYNMRIMLDFEMKCFAMYHCEKHRINKLVYIIILIIIYTSKIAFTAQTGALVYKNFLLLYMRKYKPVYSLV